MTKQNMNNEFQESAQQQPRLLAVVGVDRSQRVRCRAEGCSRPVYCRIHVVREVDGSILVLGSKCYEILYRNGLHEEALYTGTTSRPLTDEERRLLDENTEELISRFQLEADAAEAKALELEQQRKQSLQYDYHRPRKPAESDAVGGAGRTVKCHFCGTPMQTELMHPPARGYRCDTCREARVSTPLALRNRLAKSRRY